MTTMAAVPRTATAPGARRAVLAAALALGLLGAGLALYWGFADHVLDRGKSIVNESFKSRGARQYLLMAGAGLLCLLASALVATAPSLRSKRFAPLVGLGAPLCGAALVGVSAFSLGPAALVLAGALAAPSVVTAALACLAKPTEEMGLGRFLVRSWRSTGFLLGLGVLAVAGVNIAERAVPRVPWGSVLAALAIGAVLQMGAMYVTTHGAAPRAMARDHEQVRHVHDTAAMRAVAERLHPYVDEGRAAAAYDTLADDLARAAGGTATPAPAVPAGPPAVPPGLAGTAATLRAAALALPLLVVVPQVGPAVALTAFGLLLPFVRRLYAPREEPLAAAWWAAGGLLAATGGVLLVALLLPRVVTPVVGAALAGPYLVATAVAALRRRPAPGHLAHARLRHAQALAAAWWRDALRGGTVAVGAALAAPTVWAASLLVGVPLPSIPWPILAVAAAGGVFWAFAAWLAGPAARPHRTALGAEHERQVRARQASHSQFLDRLETI